MADSHSLYFYVKRRRHHFTRGNDWHHFNYYLATLVKNHRPFLKQMNLQRKMPVHEGCVNTLAWNYNGQSILSGSDDCHLCITRPSICDFQEKNYHVQHRILSGHRANIFSAQFMPFTSDTKITSCSSSGSIIVTDVNAPESSGTSLFECHKYTCYEVVPIPDLAQVFLSCSEDKTVRLFDLRTTQSCLGANCQRNILIRGGYSMTTLSINPMNPEQFLVGRSDGSGILFDRRKICKDSDLSYNHHHHHQPLTKSDESPSDENQPTDVGQLDKLKVRGLNHPAHGAVTKFTVPNFTDTHRFTSLCFSPDGRQVLASYSSDYIYLFDTDRSSNITLSQALSRSHLAGKTWCAGQYDAAGTSANDNTGSTSSTTAGPHLHRRTFRVRGDWSDTGPNSRPMGSPSVGGSASASGAAGAEAGDADAMEGRDHRQSFMSRLTRAASSLLINTPRVEEGLRAVHQDPRRSAFIGVSDLLTRGSAPAEAPAGNPASGASGAGGAYLAASHQAGGGSRDGGSASAGANTSTRSSSADDLWVSAADVGVGGEDDDDDDDDDDDHDDDDDGSDDEVEVYRDEESARDEDEYDEDEDHEEEDDDDGTAAIPDFAYNVHWARQRGQSEESDPRTRSSSQCASTSQPKPQTSGSQPAAEVTGGTTGKRPTGRNISQATKEKFSQSFRRALDAVMQIPSHRPKKVYKGHRNCRTAIKEATFWGTDYIVSGSDCGHIFVWDKSSAEVVMIFQGDERVVNCIAPNPLHYCLATSGIDYDIKLWSTQFMEHEPLCKSRDNIQKIIRINEQMIQEDLNTITMPPHFFFRVLASLASARIVEVEQSGPNQEGQGYN